MLRVALLGEQSIADDAGVVRMRSSRALALLAYLVVHGGRGQPRQRIAAALWPDSTDAQALTNLRRELHHLRQVPELHAALAGDSATLCWQDSPGCHVDVRALLTEHRAALHAAADDDQHGLLTHADAALAEYGGPLLPGAHDEWLSDARHALDEACVELCDLSCAARIRAGEPAEAVVAARRRVALRPLEEAGYRTLMQVQTALGDRAAAVSTYHHCASVLERELGVPPDAATRALLQRILAPARGNGPAAHSGHRTRVGAAAAQLIGRDRELDRLARRWRAAAAGRPGVVTVRGSAGVGKSRLVAELAAAAQEQGAVTATTQCFGSAGRLTLAPVADWLRAPEIAAAAARLDPAWRAEARRLVSGDDDGTLRVQPAGSRTVADAWRWHRVVEGLARALLATDRPTLLVLDNLQWCDQETLLVVARMLGLAPDAPVLVVATLRDEGLTVSRPVADWLNTLRAGGLLADLRLGTLGPSETASLAQAICGRNLAGADAALLHAATGGFPLHIVEAARSGLGHQHGSPPIGDLRTVLDARLEQAGDAAQQVAGLAAAVGQDFGLDLLGEASDLGVDTLVQAVDELWRLRILREAADGYDFAHDLLRDAAYARVSPPRRWLLHRRIAQGLELLHRGNTDRVAGQLAEQYLHGGRPERALGYFRRAAEIAAGMYAHAEAIRLHDKALAIIAALPEGPERSATELAELGALAAPLNAHYGYSSPRLQRVLERSVALAESLHRTDTLLTALVGLWTSRFVQGRTAEGYRTATRALQLAEPGSSRRGAAHFAAGGSALSLGRPVEAVQHLELAARLSGGATLLSIGTRPDVHATAWVAHAHWLLGEQDVALARCREAIALARGTEHPYSLAVSLAYGSITYQLSGCATELQQAVTELGELCERYGFAYYREWGAVLRGWAAAGESGTTLVSTAIQRLRDACSFARMPYWLSLLADLYRRGGDPERARASLDAAVATAHAHQDVWWLPEVLRARASFDEPRAALARLGDAGELAHAQGSIALLRRCERDAAALRTLGERTTS